MKKIVLLIIAFSPLLLFAQKPDTRAQRKAARKDRVRQLQKQAEEGAIVFDKQFAFGIKLSTDGYGGFFELGKMKTMQKANLYWLELGERKHAKEEKLTKTGGFGFAGNPFIFGKINNFYYAKLGFGQQIVLGNKGNKNGIAVSAIYGGGFSAGLLKPYYLEIDDPWTNKPRDIRYHDTTAAYFLDPGIINGASGFGKGWGELKFVPGVHLRTAFRFDYGRYNELLSALEIGLNAEYYTQTMPIMLQNKEKRFFFNAYFALTFGKRN
ncbi:MAG TPA: hypothetical protein VF145_04870 [Chitinophagaceae bacterium]